MGQTHHEEESLKKIIYLVGVESMSGEGQRGQEREREDS